MGIALPLPKDEIIKKQNRKYWILLLLVLLLIALPPVLLSLYSVQSALARLTLSFVNDRFQTQISLDRVKIRSFSELEFGGILVLDEHADTMIFVNSLSVELNKIDLTEQNFYLEELKIGEAKVQMRTYLGDSTNNLTSFFAKFSSSDSSESDFKLRCENLSLAESYFLIDDQRKYDEAYQIDYGHLEVKSIRLAAERIQIAGQELEGAIKDLSFQNPYISLTALQSQFELNSDSLKLRNMHLLTYASNINADFEMNYSKGFEQFTDDVIMKLDCESSLIHSNDIAAFTEEILGLNRPISIHGRVEGNVNDLDFEGFELNFGKNIVIDGNVGNLSNIEEIIFGDVHLNFQGDLDSIPNYPFITSESVDFPQFLAQLGVFRADLYLDGDLNAVNGELELADQNARFSAEFQAADLLSDSLSISTAADIEHLDPEALFAVQDLNEIEAKIDLYWKGTDLYSSLSKLALDISKMKYRGYTYDSIYASATLNESKLSSDLMVYDQNIKTVLHTNSSIGEEDFSTEGRLLLKGMRSHELGLTPDFDSLGLDSRLMFALDIRSNHIASIQIEVDTIKVYNRHLAYGESALSFLYKPGEKDSFNLDSELLTLKAEGDFSDVEPRMLFNELIADLGLSSKRNLNEYHDLNVTSSFGEVNPILEIFQSEIRIEKGASAQFNMSGEKRSASFSFISSRLSLGALIFEELDANLNVEDGRSQLNTNASRISLGDSLSSKNLKLSLAGIPDSMTLKLSLDDDAQSDLGLNLAALLSFDRNQMVVDLEPSELSIVDSLWQINSVAELYLDSSGLLIPLINAQSGSKFLNISGRVGDERSDKLRVSFEQLNLSNVGEISSIKELQMKGGLSGYVEMYSILNDIQLSAELDFTELEVNEQMLGSGNFSALWDKADKGLRVSGNFLDQHKPVIWFNGNYYPEEVENQLDFNLLTRDLKLKAFEPFLASYISDVSGRISGDLKLSGSIEKPRLYSDMTFQNAELRVNYLGAKFRIDGQTAKVREDWFGFDYIEVLDSRGKKARATATIFHENYQNINYDINILSEDFQFLNTSYKDNELYYGTANLGGDVNISGYSGDLLIEANVETKKGTKFYIPLEGAEEVTRSNYIVFVQPDSLKGEKPKYEAETDNIQMDLNIDMTPDAEVQLIFDEVAGDIMKASGEGAIQLGINTLGEFNMYGQYKLSSGSYLFTLQNIINKKFELTEGSSIQWNGDPFHAKLDVKARYNTRARLGDLLQDESLSSRVNTQVNLYMKNDLMNPDLSFGIEFPDMEEAIKSRAQMALNNEEQVNRQVFSLLLLNSFSPPEGGMQASGSASANSYELLANQLSNWMSHLSDKLQLSISELNATNFEVGMSRAFFSDRMTVEGSVGVTSTEDQQTESENASRLVGDVQVEYKITKDGKLRARVFNESNDDALLNQQNAKDTQGLGLVYRQEFNDWSELWKKIFGGNKQKRPAKAGP